MSQRDFWDHLIRQMCGGPAHASRIAGWAHAPLLARKRNKQVFAARAAACSVLRHTFCSHLAMRGAAPKAIQELVGHSTLSMTLRYMHLAPSALREAIDLLNFGQPVGSAESAAV